MSYNLHDKGLTPVQVSSPNQPPPSAGAGTNPPYPQGVYRQTEYRAPPPNNYQPQPQQTYPPPGGAMQTYPPPGGVVYNQPPPGGVVYNQPPPGGVVYNQPPGGVVHNQPPPGGVVYNQLPGGAVYNQPPPGGVVYNQPPGGAAPNQTAGQQWMARPDVSNCPPGLEYLSQVDQLIVKQQVELLEDSGMCMRQCCGPARGFVINITDNHSQPVLSIERNFKCCAGCCWCACSNYCAFNVKVRDRDGNDIGTVRQGCSVWKPNYTITLENGGHEGGPEVGYIQGPCFPCACPGRDVPFTITSPSSGEEIGSVTKQWSGIGRELFTDADTFSVSFPLNLDVRSKASFLGALFLIDFMFYENNNQNNRNNRRY